MLNTKEYALGIGAIIKLAREEACMTQAELAEAVDTNRAYLSGVENGTRSPGLTNLVLIATALKLPLSELIIRAEKLKSVQSSK